MKNSMETEEWNLQVQQAVTKNTSLTLNYFGTHGTHTPVENYSMDLSVSKDLKLTEKVGFSIGANFFNVLNHANFANPDYYIGSPTFGYIQSTVSVPASPYGSFVGAAASGRIIQLQGKISF